MQLLCLCMAAADAQLLSVKHINAYTLIHNISQQMLCSDHRRSNIEAPQIDSRWGNGSMHMRTALTKSPCSHVFLNMAKA